MKKIGNYTIQTLTDKHTVDGVHGNDPVYESSFESVKKIVNEAKQTPEYADKSNTGLVGTVDEMNKAIKTIEDVRKGNYDPEIIEQYIREALKKWSKDYNEIVDEMNS
jgi:lipoate synthase